MRGMVLVLVTAELQACICHGVIISYKELEDFVYVYGSGSKNTAPSQHLNLPSCPACRDHVFMYHVGIMYLPTLCCCTPATGTAAQ